MNKTLHVVITDFNGYRQTRRCLADITAEHFKDLEILVVDHGTTDDTRAGIAEDFPAVTCLRGSSDLWWAGATNLGIRAALERGAERIMLLNNDCYMAPSAITTLCRQADLHPDAIIAPVQRDAHSGATIIIAARSLMLLGFPTLLIRQRSTAALHASPLIPVRLIVGGRGALIPASVFKLIGFFDAVNLPHYGADHDFYMRAARQGLRLFTCTSAVVDVDSSTTSLAYAPGGMTIRDFFASLTNKRSHRNIAHVAALFRKQYPVPRLYFIGLLLYYLRYVLTYLIQRSYRSVTRLRKRLSSGQ